MCMHKVDSKVSKRSEAKGSGVGYKVFVVPKKKDYKIVRGDCTNARTVIGKWTKAVHGLGFLLYPTGFHIFKTYEGAEAWGCNYDDNEYILKVKYKKVLATGSYLLSAPDGDTAYYDAVVVDQLYIIPESKPKKKIAKKSKRKLTNA